jgi:uncharacterized protein YprB with RNaseH-like and TPR domain
MLDKYQIEEILFLDIETVPQYSKHDELPENLVALWEKKALQLSRIDKFNADSTVKPEDVYDRAGIYAEFGKIVCISTGVMRNDLLWIKSFFGDDEHELLSGFSQMIKKLKEKNINFLCAHNGKEFDFPYLIRRMLINRLEVPPILDLAEKKPWEVNHLDTMELWKFGDFKSFTSLELLATVFGIPSPKDDIKGSDVARVYWLDHDLPRIVAYCQKDVATIVSLLRAFKGKPMITEEFIRVVE